jgi:putative addiction module component (TIGR02574 family)
MSPTLKKLGIDRLSVDERIQLVEEIWDDIAATVEARGIPESHKALLDRRIAAYEADPGAGFTWEQVKVRLRETIGD